MLWFELCTIVAIIVEFGLFIYPGKMYWRRRDPASHASSVRIHNVPFSKTKTHFGPGTGHTLILLSLSLSVFPCLFVTLLVSLNKHQRFLGNGLWGKKKVTMAFFWHTASPQQLRIWGFHDHDGHLIKHIVVYVRARAHVCQREHDGHVVPTSAKCLNIGGRRKMVTKSRSSTFPANSGT